MTKINNEIFVRRMNKAAFPLVGEAGRAPRTEHIVALQRNIEPLGFILSPAMVEEAKRHTLSGLGSFAKDLTAILKKLKGAHVKHSPMYPNFPQQVAEASYAELYTNAFMHYFGSFLTDLTDGDVSVRIMPAYDEQERAKLETDFSKLTVINHGTEKEFHSIFTSLVGSKISNSVSDVEDIQWFVKNLSAKKLSSLLPEEIPNKENLASLAMLLHSKDADLFADVLARAKTATDLLRIAVGMSGSHPSLSAYPKIRFGKFSKADRRAFLASLDGMFNASEDMSRYAGLWKKFGEKLHPFEYASRYPMAAQWFSEIRNNLPIEKFASKVEESIKAGNIEDAVEYLSHRPGELARRLDHLLRLSVDTTVVADAFDDVASAVSTPVLLQVRNHFLHRNSGSGIRAFTPKGSIAKVQVVENTLMPLSEDICAEIVDSCNRALRQNYEGREILGNVFIDEELKRFTVPTATRSASKTLNIVGRGTRTPIDKNATQRMFIWWKDGTQRTDLDLSVVFLDEGYNRVGDVSYMDLRSVPGAVHSGDITSAPKGASEFVDIDVPKMLKGKRIRYAVMVVTSFTEQPFYELPECFAGVMTRPKAQEGDIFDARTVDNTFDLTADAKIAVPLVLDLEKAESIWADMSLTYDPSRVINVRTNASAIATLAHAVVETKRTSLYDLFYAHAQSRGIIVSSREEADVVFHADGGKVSESAEKILADYL
jgi:stress response protein SCP2